MKADSSQFEERQFGRLSALMSRAHMNPDIEEILRDPEKFLESAAITKDSRSVKAGIAPAGAGFHPGVSEEERNYFVKRYNVRSRVHQIGHMLSEKRAFKALRAACTLEKIGVRTPVHYAAAELKDELLPGVSYLVQEAIRGLMPTIPFFRRMDGDGKVKASFIRSVSRQMALMHDSGIVHGDLKLSNIYAVLPEKDGGFLFGFWDLDSARLLGEVPPWRREKEIARTASSFVEIAGREGIFPPFAQVADELMEAYNASSKVAVSMRGLEKHGLKYLRKDKVA